MSQQPPCTSEALVGAACTVSIGEHMVVPPISELPIQRFVRVALIASWSPNRFRRKPLFSNDIKVSNCSAAARIGALTARAGDVAQSCHILAALST